MNRAAWIGIAAMVVAMTSGCGLGEVAGTPVPAANQFNTPDTKDKPATRPRELRLDGKDPCATVPKTEWAKYAITGAEPQENEVFKSPSCFYNSSKASMDVTLVVTEGIEAWAPGKRLAQPVNVEPVRGFPAISLKLPKQTTECGVAVDVAQGQYLLASVVIDINDEASLPEGCTYARQFAETAMNTLVGS